MTESSAPASMHMGRRIAEARADRDLSRPLLAELCGFTPQYLGMIERGERAVNSRKTLESIARALRVPPLDLGAPLDAVDVTNSNPDLAASLEALDDLEAALTEVAFGEAQSSVKPWAQVAADVEHMTGVLWPTANTVAQAKMMPGLIRDLNTQIGCSPAHRREVLEALMVAYHGTLTLVKSLGARGLPALAALHAQRVAEELDEPGWTGAAAYLRAQSMGGGRERMRDISLKVAEIVPVDSGAGTREIQGMLQLTAALGSAALRDAATAAEHLDEATALAEGLPPDEQLGHGFGWMHFSRQNVEVWRMAIAVELGDRGQVEVIRDRALPHIMPTRTRQSAYWADLGRALAETKATREESVQALRRAEELAPTRVAKDVYVREAVVHLLTRVKRDSRAGRELRGMAHRMGISGAA